MEINVSDAVWKAMKTKLALLYSTELACVAANLGRERQDTISVDSSKSK